MNDGILEEPAALRIPQPLHAVEQVAPVAVFHRQPCGPIVPKDAQHPEQVPALLRLPAQVGVDPDLAEGVLLRADAGAEGDPVVGLLHGATVDELAAHDLRDDDLVVVIRAVPHMALHLPEEALPLPLLHLRERAGVQLLEGDVTVEVVEVGGAWMYGRWRRGRDRLRHRHRLPSRRGVPLLLEVLLGGRCGAWQAPRLRTQNPNVHVGAAQGGRIA
mmetsp:Transcript_102728/g.306907  ORF Transcript_102728/g.306907 Transcript_102728/m.306907 type:complete len:217 (-) Transcript_102728:238-888(-)